jgi:DNA-binding transcriptional LysR family regulator
MQSIEDLDTFLALVETGHMGRAAEKLGLTQPALSARLRKLETRLGLRLFDRQPSGTKLSKAGQDLVEQARHTRASLQRLDERTQAVISGEGTTVRVGMTLLAGVSRIPMLLRLVEQRSPHLRLVLHEAFSSPLEQLVAEGELDLAFVHPPIAREDLTTRTLYSESMVLSVPVDWSVPSDTEQRAAWLQEQRVYWVGSRVGPDLHRRVSTWMSKAGLKLVSTAEVSSYVIAQSFVAAGAGVALVPTCVARLHAKETRSLAIGREPELAFSIVRRRRTFGRLYELICTCVPALLQRESDVG